jgi:hypothetical protein
LARIGAGSRRSLGPWSTGMSEYRELLEELSTRLSCVVGPLLRAEEHRSARLARYAGGARLRGLDQLLAYLAAARKTYAEHPHLRPLAPLIDRLQADFETALEATLSGFSGVMSDGMRDAMEIELLLLDFAAHPGHVPQWLSADERERWQRFRPAVLRERLRAAGVEAYTSSSGRVDYAAHSMALHVTPHTAPIGARGLGPAEEQDEVVADAGFWEIFEHGARVLQAIESLRLRQRAGPDEPLSPLDQFSDARARTAEMQTLYLAMLTGPARLRKQLGREPTTAEVLRHLRDQVAGEAGGEAHQASDQPQATD